MVRVEASAMGQGPPQVVCCQPDSGEKGRRTELSFWECESQDGLPQMRGCQQDEYGCRLVDAQSALVDYDEWGCCRSRDDQEDMIATTPTNLEGLSYTPVRFDANSTIDAERSHSRYSKIVVHSTRARTQRRSKAWEDWLRAATTGRPVTLLMGNCFQSESGASGKASMAVQHPPSKVQATYYLDRGLTKLSVLVDESGVIDSQPIIILLDNIQVICPLTDFMLLADVVESQLDESERTRAALLQFKTDGAEQKRVCFLEESEVAKDRFVQALTALWLERRNDHSMWF